MTTSWRGFISLQLGLRSQCAGESIIVLEVQVVQYEIEVYFLLERLGNE